MADSSAPGGHRLAAPIQYGGAGVTAYLKRSEEGRQVTVAVMQPGESLSLVERARRKHRYCNWSCMAPDRPSMAPAAASSSSRPPFLPPNSKVERRSLISHAPGSHITTTHRW
jgi:hypothetical protein